MMWKEVVVAYFKGLYQNLTGENKKSLSHNNRSQGSDSKPGPPACCCCCYYYYYYYYYLVVR
jgi:hypothetical protein